LGKLIGATVGGAGARLLGTAMSFFVGSWREKPGADRIRQVRYCHGGRRRMAAIEDRARHEFRGVSSIPSMERATSRTLAVTRSVLGELASYVSTPRTFAPQIEAASREVVDVVGGRYPDVQALSLTPWHYYACRKPLPV
jgi:hypothetical protein